MGYSRVTISAIPDGTYGQVNAVVGKMATEILARCASAVLIADNNPANTAIRVIDIQLFGVRKIRITRTGNSTAGIAPMNVAGTSPLGYVGWYFGNTVQCTLLFSANMFAICNTSALTTLLCINKDTDGACWFLSGSLSPLYKENSDTGVQYYGTNIQQLDTNNKVILYIPLMLNNTTTRIQPERMMSTIFQGTTLSTGVLATDGVNYYLKLEGGIIVRDA